jgi:ribonuclease P protein component
MNLEGKSRFGVSVPKKVAKTAVERNKIRRRVYSVIKKVESLLITGKNSIFIMKAGSEKIGFEELTNEIKKIFVKSGLLK